MRPFFSFRHSQALFLNPPDPPDPPDPPELSEGSPRASIEEAVKANSKSHISHIMITYHDFELARTAPPTKTLEKPSESPRRERGVPGVSPARKKKKYYCNCKDLPSFPLLGSPRPQHIFQHVVRYVWYIRYLERALWLLITPSSFSSHYTLGLHLRIFRPSLTRYGAIHLNRNWDCSPVWAVLTDYDRYPDWNPSVVKMSGDKEGRSFWILDQSVQILRLANSGR